jgi:hypothetical protein
VESARDLPRKKYNMTTAAMQKAYTDINLTVVDIIATVPNKKDIKKTHNVTIAPTTTVL